MPYTQNNVAGLHRKEWQMMTALPVATAAGSFVISPDSGNFNLALFMSSATVHYLYHHDEDSFTQIPSGALAGTFGAGSCGVYHPWSIPYTATGGSTTTVTVAAASFNLIGIVKGQVIEFISAGTASGFRTTISDVDMTGGGAGTITLTLTNAAPTAILNTHTFRISSGRFYVMNGGTIAAGIFKVFDVATQAWQASLGTTNLPATFATDGKLVIAYNFSGAIDTGTSTGANTTLTLNQSTKAWVPNQFASGQQNWQIRILSGTGIGQIRNIISNTATVLTVDSVWTVLPDNTSVYSIETGEIQAAGLATAGAATTLTNGIKNWTVNQWTNYQVRITGGTGIGQVRTIASNTATILTVSVAWTTNPDATSKYEITADENSLYLLGNAAVTMYKYSISGNTWAVMAPTTARAAAPAAGMTAAFFGKTGEAVWSNENLIQDGRYIYSFRGGAAVTLDRFDIAGGTAGAGAWQAITYVGTETFTTGSAGFIMGRYFYLRKDATNRFFKYSARGNYIEPVSLDFYPDSTAALGQKIWIWNLPGSNGSVRFLYSVGNTLTTLRRLMLY